MICWRLYRQVETEKCPMKRLLFTLLLLLPVVLLTGCGDDNSSNSQVTTAPTLGSTLDAFTARYGDATQDDIDPSQYVIDTGFLGTGTTYRLTITSGLVSHIWIRIPSTDQSSKTLCWSFLPRDAKFIKLYDGSDPDDIVYVSRQLGSKFPASLFEDFGDTGPDQAPLPAPPGTFRVAYQVPGFDIATCDYWLGD